MGSTGATSALTGEDDGRGATSRLDVVMCVGARVGLVGRAEVSDGMASTWSDAAAADDRRRRRSNFR